MNYNPRLTHDTLFPLGGPLPSGRTLRSSVIPQPHLHWSWTNYLRGLSSPVLVSARQGQRPRACGSNERCTVCSDDALQELSITGKCRKVSPTPGCVEMHVLSQRMTGCLHEMNVRHSNSWYKPWSRTTTDFQQQALDNMQEKGMLLTLSCSRTLARKNCQQFSLESTMPRARTSLRIPEIILSTSSSLKRSGMSPAPAGRSRITERPSQFKF